MHNAKEYLQNEVNKYKEWIDKIEQVEQQQTQEKEVMQLVTNLKVIKKQWGDENAVGDGAGSTA